MSKPTKSRRTTVPHESFEAAIRVTTVSRGKLFWMKQVNSEEEALQQLQKHTVNYAHRITVYKKDGKTVKREVAEYDQREKEWLD